MSLLRIRPLFNPVSLSIVTFFIPFPRLRFWFFPFLFLPPCPDVWTCAIPCNPRATQDHTESHSAYFPHLWFEELRSWRQRNALEAARMARMALRMVPWCAMVCAWCAMVCHGFIAPGWGFSKEAGCDRSPSALPGAEKQHSDNTWHSKFKQWQNHEEHECMGHSQIEDMFASNLFAQFLLTQQLGDSSDTLRHEALSLIESNHLRENRRSPCSATVQRCALATPLCPKFSVYKCCLQSCTSTNIYHYDEALQISSE